MGVPPLTNNTGKTTGEDLVKIGPAVAEQSRRNMNNTNKQEAQLSLTNHTCRFVKLLRYCRTFCKNT